MKLLVDIGNSRMKWAWLDKDGLANPGSMPHGGQVPRQALDAVRATGHRPAAILVASVVVPALTTAIVESLRQALAASVLIAQTEAAAAGVRNGYVEPRQLGVDRWLAMLAAFARYKTAVCVVDAGTALTVDAVAPDGRHLGGMMVPGPALMRRALVGETGGIGPATDILGSRGASPDLPADIWGRDTETCIRLGSRQGAACLVENGLKALTRLTASDGVLVLTGGDAPALMGALAVPFEHRPLLVLEGLALRHGGTPA